MAVDRSGLPLERRMQSVIVHVPYSFTRGVRFACYVWQPGQAYAIPADMGLLALALGLEVYGEDGVRVGSGYG